MASFLLLVLGFIIYALYISATRKNRIKRVDKMRRNHPSFDDRFGKLGASESLSWEQLKSIVSVSEDEMRKSDFEYAKKEELRRIERQNAAAYERLQQKYPLGIALFKRRNPSAKQADFISKEVELKRLNELGYQHKAFSKWAKRQSVFSEKSLSLSPEHWGCYSYLIDVAGIDENGENKNHLFMVWQHFYSSYCRDAALDYTYFPNKRKNCEYLDDCRKKQRYFKDIVYDELLSIICNISDKVLVLFSGSGNLPDITSYPHSLNAYHFKYLKEQLGNKGIRYFEIDYDSYELNDEQNVIIVEFDTNNTRLEVNCRDIFTKYRDKAPCITYISIYKEFSSDEMSLLITKRNNKLREEEEKKRAEAERERLEREKKRQEEERRKKLTDSLKKSVSSWEIVPYSELHHKYLIRYYPTTCDFEATDSEWNDRQLIWSFKNDPNKTTRIPHQQALSILIPRLKDVLRSTFGDLLPNLTLVCIPASTPDKNKARYEYFSEQLCHDTGMANAYSHITINTGRTARHEGGVAGGTDTISFDAEFFKGKNILLFDDVLTRGDSMRKYGNKMTSLGANVIAGITIGKTFHNRVEDVLPIGRGVQSYHVSLSNEHNDYDDDLPF